MSLLDKICRALIKMIRKKDSTKLVWKNASPTSAFAPQKINIDLSDADIIKVFFKRYTTATKEFCADVYVHAAGTMLFGFGEADGAGVSFVTRLISVDESGVTFEKGHDKVITSTSAGGENRSSGVPVRIYKIISGGARVKACLRRFQTFARGCFVCLAY